MGKVVGVDFKLEIPFGEGNPRSLDYRLNVESFKSKDEVRDRRSNYSENLERLKRGGFNRNLFPYERWDIIFRGIYQNEKGLEELALDLLQTREWYGVDMMSRLSEERVRLNEERECSSTASRDKDGTIKFIERKSGYEFVFKMPDGTLCSFGAVFTEDSMVSFGKLADKNPDLFRFVYGRTIEEIREATARHKKVSEGVLSFGGPFSEFLGGQRISFTSGIHNTWLHGMSGGTFSDHFHIDGNHILISRGVKYVER